MDILQTHRLGIKKPTPSRYIKPGGGMDSILSNPAKSQIAPNRMSQTVWGRENDGSMSFGNVKVGAKFITITPLQPSTLIQQALNYLNSIGGGTLHLQPGTYNVAYNIVVPSNVNIIGEGPDTIIDFGSGAHQFQVEGSTAYSTGTVAVTNNSATVTGSGTTWTAAMVGQSILIGDFWYTITARASNTSITIGEVFLGPTASGQSYVIATTVDNVFFVNLTIQNSTSQLILAKYVNGLQLDNVILFNGLVGLDGQSSAFINILNSDVDSCGTGLKFTTFEFGTLFNSNVTNSTSGGGLICNGISNWCLESLSFQNNTGPGMQFKNAINSDLLDFSVGQTTGIGIEFVSGNTDFGITAGTITHGSTDGIKLDASTNQSIFSNLQIHDNGGYGINIAVSSNNSTLILGNFFSTNTSGAVSDSGTGTLIRSNIGQVDN